MFLSLTRFLAPLRSGLGYSERCRRDARLAHYLQSTHSLPTLTHRAASAADARADAAARAAVSVVVVVIVCASVAKQAAFCAAVSGTRAVGAGSSSGSGSGVTAICY